MLDPAINSFFDERKEAWLKKKVKASMAECEVEELKAECETVFSLEQWLPNAAKRAGQISMATHPCTFSHPSARKNKNGYVTSVIANAKRINDGFLKSGNVEVDMDALGNAAALDVYKFLTLEMMDNDRLLDHIKNDSNLAVNLLDIKTARYQELKNGFLAMVNSADENITSSKIKQVYFPVKDNYHQLSILTNSGMLYQLRKRIDTLRFSDDTKVRRELKRKNEFSEHGFSEIYNLTTIGYGGTKPQNISVLNNQNGGKAHLLSSLPPQLDKRSIHFPRSNFFNESFRAHEYRDVFQALHRLFLIDYKNNLSIRNSRDARIQELLDRIIDKMWAIRSVSVQQYNSDSSSLESYQKTWLHNDDASQRQETDDWLDELVNDIASWMGRTYKKVIGKKAVMFGEEERLHFIQMVEKNKEALR
jgi:CRISPR-associated protein Csy1